MTDIETIQRIHGQIATLEEWRHTINVERAAEKVRMEHIDERLEQINGSINKLIWTIIAGAVGYFVTWVMGGGLVGAA